MSIRRKVEQMLESDSSPETLAKIVVLLAEALDDHKADVREKLRRKANVSRSPNSD